MCFKRKLLNVLYRIGSLEKFYNDLFDDEFVLYRIGSLEIARKFKNLLDQVLYRIGSLERN